SDETADSSEGDAVPDDDGEAVAGGTPVVGSGPCRFTVATTPAGSIVRLDDQAMGPSPITIEGSCDKHKIDVSHARYQSVTKWLTLAADQPQTLDISLPRPTHAVTVTSFPPGAELSIDGHRAGTTPTVVQMTGFATVNLTFTKPGFQTVTKKVYSKVAQDRVFVKLMK
ncbi:MAG TPA: PEGA domain-containing protein, partial [Kofleriaceae bacterium]